MQIPQPHQLQGFIYCFYFCWQAAFKVSDGGMAALFKFLAMIFGLVGSTLGVSSLKEFASSLPSSLLAGRKALGTSTDDFEKFVCCPTCSCIYRIEDCQERLPNGKIVSKKCSFIQFPQHPHAKATPKAMWNYPVKNCQDFLWIYFSVPSCAFLSQRFHRIFATNAKTS